MLSHEIVIFSVSHTITQRIHTILSETNQSIPVYELQHFDVLKKAQELINLGTQVIISRGGTAALLRSHLNIPVIEILHDHYGIAQSIKEAKKYGENIVAIGFPQYCRVLQKYQQKTHEQFKICRVYTHYDVENIISELAEQGYKVVIGGLAVAHMAHKYGLDVIMGDADNLSIENAINEAKHILKCMKQKNAKLIETTGALNCVSEGVMCISSYGNITRINTLGEKLFSCVVGDNIFQDTNFKSLFDYIIGEKDVFKLPISIKDRELLIDLRNIKRHNNYFIVVSGKLSRNNQQNNNKPAMGMALTAKYTFDDIIGHSPAITASLERAKKFAQYDFPVNLYGKTGTGKELFAQGIHNASARHRGVFIAVNCAALPESLLESELFGYAEGSFTGAQKGGKAGVFELANHGTIFIDEISEAPLSVQVKLLRVLQEKAFVRIGGRTLINTDFRLITASNKKLSELVEKGKFREDLYYRINILELHIPPLNERPEDIIPIIGKILQHNQCQLELAPEVENYLRRYSWPGNVRQLQAFVNRLIVLADSHEVTLSELLQMHILEDIPEVCELKESACLLDQTHLIKRTESRLIADVLNKTAGDKKKSAYILGISQTTLWRKIKMYEIDDSLSVEYPGILADS
ncbi:sigma 54-interacting transcriptional regulator [Celerinatantimonas diazotrophica]|uniref:Transcriptional regulator with PAS, ATPase and Fis domain n=1 Tax=Celerinatantimonas diazotrophica TaxID=412034 RepID=A0A4R1KK03_9GAMM|nr:sigma 54-interacting transcriptional regulator [Celerinatantimonas diazotrophica]TCK63969.1 transcriptional regulator with PAS, ATPase and Fis domain [Celerinatantimonas diazotrophica]CAG9297054.1 Anaerobic nitric oxide reductase transcription regulator NorR [Celerinatantimonas diazotrophica]